MPHVSQFVWEDTRHVLLDLLVEPQDIAVDLTFAEVNQHPEGQPGTHWSDPRAFMSEILAILTLLLSRCQLLWLLREPQ